jgi:mannose-6-phosphate isomerase-like protein (cupin superfamily)
VKRLRATQLLSVIRTASSMPVVVATDDGKYVTKLRGAGQGLRALIAEVVIAELAEQVGLRVPSRAVIDLDVTDHDHEVREVLERSRGENLGFAWIDGEMFKGQAIDGELASRIVVFDTFVMNVDRRAKKPNLLLADGVLYLIDHGAVLLFEGCDVNERIVFDHVLSPFATDVPRQSGRMRMMLDRPQIGRAVARVPRGWMTDEERRAMVDVIANRVAAWSEWSSRIGVGNVGEGGREASRIRGTMELLGESIDLATRAGLRDVRVEHEVLRPGRRSSSPHYHTRREELVYVLRGTPTVVIDDQPRILHPGEYVGFPAGAPNQHFLRNDTTDDAEYLVVATKPADDETRY